MQVTIYRSSVKEGLYAYVQAGSAIDSLPEAVLKQLGKPEKAMDLELDGSRTLPNADVNEVVDAIQSQGFYIQMPTNVEELLERLANQSAPTEK